MRLAIVFALTAGPALADDAALLGYMGGQGCTFGVQSMAGAVAAGFDAAQIDRFITDALESGDATQQGLWTVLNYSICTIRLPELISPILASDPEILALAPYVSETFDSGDGPVTEEGCFFAEGQEFFTGRNDGDVDAGYADYLTFLGASIIAGEARFYSSSPLVTPRGFQLTAGECGAAPNVPDVLESQPLISEHFGEYVRRVGEETVCGDPIGPAGVLFAAEIQGSGPMSSETDMDGINAWLWFEWDVITRAAGWYEGVSGTDMGVPRPPLCHYLD